MTKETCPVCGVECAELVDLTPLDTRMVCPDCFRYAQQGVRTVLLTRGMYLKGVNEEH